jgi:ketosteroid isomerase-like protein
VASVADALARLAAESEIHRTIAAYCQTCDDGRFEEYGECFATDAVVAVMGEEIVGRNAIVAWISKAMPADKRGKHVTINSLVTVDPDATRATAHVDYLFVAKSPNGPRMTQAGRYLDVLVPEGDRWVFVRREITFLGDSPAG